MAQSKLTALTALSPILRTDLTYAVSDPGGTPASKKVTVETLKAAMSPARIVTVGATGADYSTLSSALAAITDASASKHYTIIVSGDIAESAMVTAKSYVDVIGTGSATITVAMSALGKGFLFSGVTDLLWANLTLAVSGAIGAAHWVHTVSFESTSDKTVRLRDCTVKNLCTGTGYENFGLIIADTGSPDICRCQITAAATSGIHQWGACLSGSGSPTFCDCDFYGGDNGLTAYGVYLESGSPELYNCRYYGGAGGAGSNGLVCWAGTPVVDGGRAVGGSTGACHGLSMETGGGTPTIRNLLAIGGSAAGGSCFGLNAAGLRGTIAHCTFQGGGGGASCYGAYVSSDSNVLQFKHCGFEGGDGGIGGVGLWVQGASAPQFEDCWARGGAGGDSSPAIRLQGATSSVLSGVRTVLNTRLVNWAAITATTTKTISATIPTQIASIALNVTVAGTGGATVSVGTTLAGTEIINAQSITTTGWKYPILVEPTARSLLVANATIYITISGTGSPSLDIYTSYIISYASCYGLYIYQGEYVRINNCSVLSVCTSDAVYIGPLAQTANKLVITNSHLEALPKEASSAYAASADSAYASAPIYNCTLVGGLSNITPAAGTAAGSNIIP